MALIKKHYNELIPGDSNLTWRLLRHAIKMGFIYPQFWKATEERIYLKIPGIENFKDRVEVMRVFHQNPSLVSKRFWDTSIDVLIDCQEFWSLKEMIDAFEMLLDAKGTVPSYFLEKCKDFFIEALPVASAREIIQLMNYYLKDP